MAKVYDPAQQQIVDVSASEATRGLREGKYQAAGRTRIARDDGEMGTIDSSELLGALDSGFRVVDDDEAGKISERREAQSSASMAVGLAEAALAGVTLGGSTYVDEALGDDPERMRARREALGTAGDVAEVGGAILPSLVTGGGSTAASGASLAARGASTGLRLTRGSNLASRALSVTPAGLASRLAERTGAGLASRGAGRIVSTGGREFVEGAAQGIGQEIDESVLGGRELSADRLASQGLMAGAFGLGAGIAVPGLARVATGAVKAPIAGVQKILGRTNPASGGVASREVAEIIADGGLEMSPQARLWERNAIAQGIDPQTANRLARMGDSAEGRADIVSLERDRPKIEREAAELVGSRVNAVHEEMRAVKPYVTGKAKEAQWAKAARSAGPEVQRAANGALDGLPVTAQGRMEAAIAKNHEDFKRFGAAPHNGAVLAQGDEAIGHLRREIAEAEGLTGADQVAAKAAAADAYKRRLGVIIEENGGWGSAARATPETRRSLALLKELYDEPRTLLETDTLFTTAAASQKELNAAYQRWAAADDLFEDATRGTGLGSIIDPDGTINIPKALKLVRAHGRIGGDVTVTRLMDAMQARVAYLKMVGKHAELDDAGRGSIARVEQQVADLDREFKRQAVMAGKLDDLNEARRVEGNGSPSLLTTGTSLAGLIGFNIGGPIGALGGAALVAARQPHTSLHRYAAIVSQLDKAQIRLDCVVAGMFSAGAKIKAPKLPRLPIGALAGAVQTRTGKEQKERREIALAKAGEILQSPTALARTLNVPLYDVPPGISSAIQDRVQAAASFLQSKAPRVYSRGQTKLVDPGSAASFERYLEAVVDPIGALERFETGRITQETAEAIRVVYPALYADIQERIVEQLAEAQAEGREIPYEKRVRMGQLFQTKTDPSLDANVANEIQASIGANLDEPDAATVMAAAKQNKPGKLEGASDGLQTASDHIATWRAS